MATLKAKNAYDREKYFKCSWRFTSDKKVLFLCLSLWASKLNTPTTYVYTHASMHTGFSPGLGPFYNLGKFYRFPSVNGWNWAIDDHKAEGLRCSLALGIFPWLLLLEKWQVFNKGSEWLEKKKDESELKELPFWTSSWDKGIRLNSCLVDNVQLVVSCLFSECCGLVLAIRTWVMLALRLFLFHLHPFIESREQNEYFLSSFTCYFLFLQSLWTFRSMIMLWTNKILFTWFLRVY